MKDDPVRRSVCLFCSSAQTLPANTRALAEAFGRGCAARRLRLVYGGSRHGLMGIAARAAAASGGEVLGIMPRILVQAERAADDIGELRIVATLAERKERMASESGAFVALPGGIGTLNELIEMLTLDDLGLQAKPVILCSDDGFWQPFLDLLERLAAYGVLRPRVKSYLRLASSVTQALDQAEEALRAAVPGGSS